MISQEKANELWPLIHKGVHSYTHFYTCVAKKKTIDLLAHIYPRTLLEEYSFQTLLDLAQLHCLETYAKGQSPRQKEVQRLWQQRGLLERTKANLRSIIIDGSIKSKNPTRILFGLSEVEELIRTNVEQMKTISQRIPKSENTN